MVTKLQIFYTNNMVKKTPLPQLMVVFYYSIYLIRSWELIHDELE